MLFPLRYLCMPFEVVISIFLLFWVSSNISYSFWSKKKFLKIKFLVASSMFNAMNRIKHLFLGLMFISNFYASTVSDKFPMKTWIFMNWDHWDDFLNKLFFLSSHFQAKLPKIPSCPHTRHETRTMQFNSNNYLLPTFSTFVVIEPLLLFSAIITILLSSLSETIFFILISKWTYKTKVEKKQHK